MQNSARSEKISPIRAVLRVCDILDVLQNTRDGLSPAEIAERTGIPKSTVHRYISALERRCYVERSGSSNITRLGLVFRPKSSRETDQLLDAAVPVLEKLRDQTDETANLGLLDGGRFVYAVVVESRRTIRVAARQGDRGMLHSTAMGKVIAAQLPDDRVYAMLMAEGMPRFTDKTITTAEAYVREVAKVRESGSALDDGEAQEGARCVAVPIEGAPVACGLSISGPVDRLQSNDLYAATSFLEEAAANLSKRCKELVGRTSLSQ
jgi:IclR family acetate operon transcriptional repressor